MLLTFWSDLRIFYIKSSWLSAAFFQLRCSEYGHAISDLSKTWEKLIRLRYFLWLFVSSRTPWLWLNILGTWCQVLQAVQLALRFCWFIRFKNLFNLMTRNLLTILSSRLRKIFSLFSQWKVRYATYLSGVILLLKVGRRLFNWEIICDRIGFGGKGLFLGVWFVLACLCCSCAPLVWIFGIFLLRNKTSSFAVD